MRATRDTSDVIELNRVGGRVMRGVRLCQASPCRSAYIRGIDMMKIFIVPAR
jgi:hypothetical protein